MNTGKALVFEYLIALGIISWADMSGAYVRDPEARKTSADRYWPFPRSIVLTTVAFGILGMLAIPVPKLAGVFGAGLLLAQIVLVLDDSRKGLTAVSGIAYELDNSPYFEMYGAIKPSARYLKIGGISDDPREN